MLQSMGSQRVRHDLATEHSNKYFHLRQKLENLKAVEETHIPQGGSGGSATDVMSPNRHFGLFDEECSQWRIHGEIVADFILGGSKITADGDCSHEIKMLASWKKIYDQPR